MVVVGVVVVVVAVAVAVVVVAVAVVVVVVALVVVVVGVGVGARRGWSPLFPLFLLFPGFSPLSSLSTCAFCFGLYFGSPPSPLHAIPTPPRPTPGSRGGWGLVAYCRELRAIGHSTPTPNHPTGLMALWKSSRPQHFGCVLVNFSPKKHVPHPTLPRWVRMRMKGEDGECSNSDKNEDENHHRTSTGRGV